MLICLTQAKELEDLVTEIHSLLRATLGAKSENGSGDKEGHVTVSGVSGKLQEENRSVSWTVNNYLIHPIYTVQILNYFCLFIFFEKQTKDKVESKCSDKVIC